MDIERKLVLIFLSTLLTIVLFITALGLEDDNTAITDTEITVTVTTIVVTPTNYQFDEESMRPPVQKTAKVESSQVEVKVESKVVAVESKVEEPTTFSDVTIEYTSDYENAHYIWNYLKSAGYNNYVVAGIMGNIMAEVGGHTLRIPWYVKGYGYYGICQWMLRYSPDVEDQDLKGQLDFLIKTMPKNMQSYEVFITLQDEQEAALMFARQYERCTSASYYKRQVNASKAYNYFVG